jgi:hypothetical protein
MLPHAAALHNGTHGRCHAHHWQDFWRQACFGSHLCLVYSSTHCCFFCCSSGCSPFHRVIVVGSISLHCEVMNAVCQIAHARAAEAATRTPAAPSDGRASPSATPVFNFTSSIMPPIACISTTMHSHMARALFWDSEFRCAPVARTCYALPYHINACAYACVCVNDAAPPSVSAVRDAIACDRCVPVDALRVTFDNRSMCDIVVYLSTSFV